MKHIAVERGMANVADYLKSQGYNVDEVEVYQKSTKDFIDGFDAIIISGLDQNISGFHDAMGKASIIDARGLTPRQIKDELEKRIQ